MGAAIQPLKSAHADVGEGKLHVVTTCIEHSLDDLSFALLWSRVGITRNTRLTGHPCEDMLKC